MGQPSKPLSRTFDSDGLVLHYLDWGNYLAPPMVLVHGTASHAHVWDRFAAALSDKFHVVAMDQRGHGDSGWPADYRTGYLPGVWSHDLAALIERLDLPPVVLVGLSAGGNTSMHYTAAHPDRVARLIVVEMGPQAGKEGVDRVISSIPARETFESEDDVVNYLGGGGRAEPTLARAHALHSVRPVEDGTFAMKGDPSLRRRDWRRPLWSAEENWAVAHAITVPTLLVRGADSKLLTPEIAKRMEQEMQDCTLVTIEGAGHAVPLHRPAEFELAIRSWLDQKECSTT